MSSEAVHARGKEITQEPRQGLWTKTNKIIAPLAVGGLAFGGGVGAYKAVENRSATSEPEQNNAQTEILPAATMPSEDALREVAIAPEEDLVKPQTQLGQTEKDVPHELFADWSIFESPTDQYVTGIPNTWEASNVKDGDLHVDVFTHTDEDFVLPTTVQIYYFPVVEDATLDSYAKFRESMLEAQLEEPYKSDGIAQGQHVIAGFEARVLDTYLPLPDSPRGVYNHREYVFLDNQNRIWTLSINTRDREDSVHFEDTVQLFQLQEE